MKKSILYVGVGLTIGIMINTVSAWVEPDQMPPGGNIAAPINTSNIGQSKIGGMIIALGDVINGLIVKNGKSGFGLDTPTERVDVNGNIKLNGKIIGLQAPTDANDAVNKGYVDALGSGGGGTYTAWGTTECTTGWTVAYVGLAAFPKPNSTGGDTLCIKGDKNNFRPGEFVFDGSNFELDVGLPNWTPGQSQGLYTRAAITCVICVK